MTYIRKVDINSPLTPFKEIPTSQRTPLIELKSVYGLSNLRDIVEEDGVELISSRASTRVDTFDGRFRIQTPATGSTKTRLSSAEYGRYMPGYSAQVGIGFQHGNPITGDQIRRWGYFDDEQGFYFKETVSEGVSCVIRRDNTETVVRREDWILDKLDGTGSSGLTIDVSSNNPNGYIYQIDFVHYGYGPIIFSMDIFDPEIGVYRNIPVHAINLPINTSVNDPNLPIAIEIDNGTTASAQLVYVGGRQFSVDGRYVPSFRSTYTRFEGVNITNAFTPIFSTRRKANSNGVRILPSQISSLVATNDCIGQIWLNATLTGESYGNLPDIDPGETKLELDTSATAFSGGDLLFEFLMPAGQGSKSAPSSSRSEGLVIPRRQPITLVMKTFTGGATANIVASALEEW